MDSRELIATAVVSMIEQKDAELASLRAENAELREACAGLRAGGESGNEGRTPGVGDLGPEPGSRRMTTEQDEARRLAERIVRGDADSSLPSVYESHRLTLARALLRLLDALDAAEGQPRWGVDWAKGESWSACAACGQRIGNGGHVCLARVESRTGGDQP